MAAGSGPVGVMISFGSNQAGRVGVMIFISPAGGWAGLDDEGFLKDLAFERPSAGPAGRPARPQSRRQDFLFAGMAGP